MNNKAADQTARMRRLICAFVVRIWQNMFSHDVAHMKLNFVSSQCARGKSSIARKPEVHPEHFNGKKLLKNIALQILNFILVS